MSFLFPITWFLIYTGGVVGSLDRKNGVILSLLWPVILGARLRRFADERDPES